MSARAGVTKTDFDGKVYTISGVWQADNKKGEFMIKFDAQGKIIDWRSWET